MLKKLYISLALIFIASSVVYFIYRNPNLPDGVKIPAASILSQIISQSTPQPTFNTTTLSDIVNQPLATETPLATPAPTPFCDLEPCVSTVTSIENAFKNCQVQGVNTSAKNITLIHLKNDQFIQVPRTTEGEELDIQSMINNSMCNPKPVWVLE